MPEYTMNPIPVYEARQINTQEDGDAWVASLTDNELVTTGRAITNVRIEVVEDTVWLKFTDTSDIGSSEYAMDFSVGGYAMANKNNSNIFLTASSEASFNQNYQPYPIL